MKDAGIIQGQSAASSGNLSMHFFLSGVSSPGENFNCSIPDGTRLKTLRAKSHEFYRRFFATFLSKSREGGRSLSLMASKRIKAHEAVKKGGYKGVSHWELLYPLAKGMTAR